MTEAVAAPASRSQHITGWILSVLAALPFVPSAAMKLAQNPQAVGGLAHVGLSPRGVVVLGALELLLVVLYLVPRTAVLGAVLLTGYVGGIIVAHLTMGVPLWLPIVLGVTVWAGIWLREPRLRALVPLR